MKWLRKSFVKRFFKKYGDDVKIMKATHKGESFAIAHSQKVQYKIYLTNILLIILLVLIILAGIVALWRFGDVIKIVNNEQFLTYIIEASRTCVTS